MFRQIVSRVSLLLILALMSLGLLAGCAGLKSGGTTPAPNPTPTPTPTKDITAVKHIVLFMQENRSFDEYFGQLNQYRVSKGLPADVDDLSKAGNVSLPTWDGSPNVA